MNFPVEDQKRTVKLKSASKSNVGARKVRSKKSLIPKREGNAEKISDETTPTPEVRSAVKDIIKLLKGLDNISDSPFASEYGPDDVTAVVSQDLTLHELDLSSNAASAPNGTRSTSPSSSRPVRVSHVILKHEDPTFTKVTFETFDSDIPPGQTTPRTKDVTAEKVISNENLKRVKIRSSASRTNRGLQGNKSDDTPVRRVPKDATRINNLHVINTALQKAGQKNLLHTDGKGSKQSADMIKLRRAHYKTPMSGRKNEDNKYLALKHNIVYREPNLNIFLPLEPRQVSNSDSLWPLRLHSRQDAGPPANFGAPYFRLDGALLDDSVIARAPPLFDINRLVKRAVQQQQRTYLEATENIKSYNRKLINQEYQQESAARGRSRRYLT